MRIRVLSADVQIARVGVGDPVFMGVSEYGWNALSGRSSVAFYRFYYPMFSPTYPIFSHPFFCHSVGLLLWNLDCTLRFLRFETAYAVGLMKP